MTFGLSPSALKKIRELSESSGYSPTELVRLGVATVAVILDAQARGHLIVEATRDGKGLTEIKFPQPEAITDLTRKILAEPYSLSLERAISDLDPDNESNNPSGRVWPSPTRKNIDLTTE